MQSKLSFMACPKCKTKVLNETLLTTNDMFLHCPSCNGHFKIATQRYLTVKSVVNMYTQHLN